MITRPYDLANLMKSIAEASRDYIECCRGSARHRTMIQHNKVSQCGGDTKRLRCVQPSETLVYINYSLLSADVRVRLSFYALARSRAARTLALWFAYVRRALPRLSLHHERPGFMLQTSPNVPGTQLFSVMLRTPFASRQQVCYRSAPSSKSIKAINSALLEHLV